MNKREKVVTPFDKAIAEITSKANNIRRNKDKGINVDDDLSLFNKEFEKFKETWANDIDVKKGSGQGKAETSLVDPLLEIKRLYNNHKSRQAKKRGRDLEKQQTNRWMTTYGKANDDEDEHGISPKDEKRYITCFKTRKSYGEECTLKYVKGRCGLSLNQIYILQCRTGLIPIPPVTETEAKRDEKKRWRLGITY